MSALCASSSGWLLDARALIDRGHATCVRWTGGRKSHVKCSFKEQCFQVLTSHGCHGNSAALEANNTETVERTDKQPKKRKRKQGALNQGEIDSQAFHEKIRSVVLEGTKSLLESARSLGYLNGHAETVKEPVPCHECSLAALCEMAKELPLAEDEEQQECSQALATEGGCTSHVDLFSRVTENKEDRGAVVSLMGEEYVIPPRTAFLLSDFTRTQPLVQYGRRYDLIVMDPPWENKSVKRSRRYSSLPSSQLKRLPIPLLASPGCLVVTWVTNRPSHQRFVREELYPHWGVQVVAEWFWVKVTTSGQLVFPLDSPHKKPYETLVLGRYRPPADTPESSSDVAEPPVEDGRLIVSVPSVLHSHKPSLSEVLRPYVRAEARRLELFARNLQPGWTSWGNEVLKFQHTGYFTLTPSDDPRPGTDPPGGADPDPPQPGSPGKNLRASAVTSQHLGV
ncbi:N(6)-adenine-specific methyltransferase METTL4 isoform 1-T1 [Menidia menidia]